MGIMQKIFGPPDVQTQPPMPRIQTALTQAAVDAILSGQFPSMPVQRLVLHKGEKCFYCDHAVRIIEKLKVVGYRSRGFGGYVRVFRGAGLHTGDGFRAAVRNHVPEYKQGKLYITNERIIFFADSGAFQKRLKDVISFGEAGADLVLQFNATSCRLYLQTLTCALRVLEHLL